MTKAEVTITFTVTYEINPRHYPDCQTLDEMLAVDVSMAEYDPITFIDQEDVRIEANGRILESEK